MCTCISETDEQGRCLDCGEQILDNKDKMSKEDWDAYEKYQRAVLLNGNYVQPEVVDPTKHRYVGMFRPPVNPVINPTTDILCRCGEILKYRGQEVEHYRRGCYDVPQYVDIMGDE